MYVSLQLLSQSFIALRLLVAASDPGDTREPRADVEVILAGLRTANEPTLWEDGWEVVLDVVDDVLPVVGREGKEVCAGGFALVDLEDSAVCFELSCVELLESSTLW